jgi:Tfp pilus assembly pilus retraction ATPase PilT
MTNVIFAAKKTTTDVLATVSTATTAISAVTEIASLYATDYRDQVKQDLADSAVRRQAIRKSERAIEVASFYMDLNKRLEADPHLKAAYQEAMEGMQQLDQEYADKALKLAAE